MYSIKKTRTCIHPSFTLILLVVLDVVTFTHEGVQYIINPILFPPFLEFSLLWGSHINHTMENLKKSGRCILVDNFS